jgi:hypothetical protein
LLVAAAAVSRRIEIAVLLLEHVAEDFGHAFNVCILQGIGVHLLSLGFVVIKPLNH